MKYNNDTPDNITEDTVLDIVDGGVNDHAGHDYHAGIDVSYTETIMGVRLLVRTMYTTISTIFNTSDITCVCCISHYICGLLTYSILWSPCPSLLLPPCWWP